jgi:hypothetical protein
MLGDLQKLKRKTTKKPVAEGYTCELYRVIVTWGVRTMLAVFHAIFLVEFDGSCWSYARCNPSGFCIEETAAGGFRYEPLNSREK